MNAANPLRILISSTAQARIGDKLKNVLGGCQYELVAPAVDPDNAPPNIHVGYCSRDITGLSTKYHVLPPLESFYASLRRSPDLQWVHLHSAGLDRPICNELTQRGVKVTGSPGANAEIVAQTALTGILMLARHFPLLLAQQQQRQWSSLVKTGLPRDLAGQTVLIAGWGPIGKRIASLLQMLGMTVLVARSSNTPVNSEIQTFSFEEIGNYAKQLDWLVLACPLTERTRGWINKAVLDTIKPGARIVNIARGEIIDEPALIDALQRQHLSGAFLDVFAHEPLDPESPLWAIDNVIVTPHSAGHSHGNENRVDQIFLNQLHDFKEQMATVA